MAENVTITFVMLVNCCSLLVYAKSAAGAFIQYVHSKNIVFALVYFHKVIFSDGTEQCTPHQYDGICTTL